MATEQGKEMLNALRAVLSMQRDCIKLFEDLDRFMNGFDSVNGNTVTQGLKSTIFDGRYLADGLFRLYAREGNDSNILGVNICFYNEGDAEFTEPLFIVANLKYQDADIDQAQKRYWDPWYAFFDWNAKREYNKAISIEQPAKREAIEWVTVAAMPLFEITRLEQATNLINLVGRP